MKVTAGVVSTTRSTPPAPSFISVMVPPSAIVPLVKEGTVPLAKMKDSLPPVPLIVAVSVPLELDVNVRLAPVGLMPVTSILSEVEKPEITA